MASRTKLNIDGLNTLRAKLGGAVNGAILATAISVRDEARELAPKDTTGLAESIHVVTSDYSDYEEAMSNAKEKFEEAKAAGKTPKGYRLGPKSQFKGLEEVRPDDPLEAWVVVGMAYGVEHEFGSVRVGARPFLRPALLNNEPILIKSISKAMQGLVSVKATFTEYSKL